MISQVHLESERNSTMNLGKSTYELRFFDLIFLAAEISASLWVHIHFFETTLRDFMHRTISQALSSQEWITKSGILSKHESRQVKYIIQLLKKRSLDDKNLNSKLSMSFWVELCSARYHQKVWRKLEQANPMLYEQRRDFYKKAREIRNLRNSIAHHGPILRRNLLRDLTYLNELTSLLNPTLAIEVAKRSRALELIQNAQLVGSGGGI